jgi:glycosyltransferase involved in cell wall biosynthesis
MALSPEVQSLSASVIVPVLDGAETLDACLGALSRQTMERARYEVIVVDDGSSDGTARVAARPGVTVIRQDHAGAAAARNRGAQQARGQVLLFTDSDCEPLPDWVEQMLAPFADPEVAGVRGVYRTRQRAAVARFAQAEYEEKYGRLARAGAVDFVDTYAAAYRRSVFVAHQGFHPGFLLDEDQEFSYRLAREGCKLAFAPAAVVVHRHPATLWGYAWRKVKLGRWKVRVHVRHPAKALHDSYTPWTQKAQIALLPLVTGAAVAAALGLVSWMAVAILAVLGLASSGPLLAKAARQGRRVLLLAPLFILIRALALGLGLAWGLGDQIRPLAGREDGSGAVAGWR